MTAEEIFNRAVVLMFGEEVDKSDYEPFFLGTLNVLLGENFHANNALRRMQGLEDLENIPIITDMDDEVPYEEIFTHTVLPYGVAGYIYSDDDRGMGTEYKNKYEYERTRLTTSIYEDVEDVYKQYTSN